VEDVDLVVILVVDDIDVDILSEFRVISVCFLVSVDDLLVSVDDILKKDGLEEGYYIEKSRIGSGKSRKSRR